MNLSSFDLNLLLVLEAVLEERNVTRAAKRVGLSQPATSSALRRLRELLADPLLVRSGRQMLLTSRAEQLMPSISSALHQVRQALEDRPGFDASAAGRSFTILANDYAELMILPALLRSLNTANAAVTLRFQRTEALFHAPVEQLSFGNADLAIGFVGPTPATQSSLAFEELWKEQNVAIARKGHPRIRGLLSRLQFLEERHAAIFYHKLQTGLVDSVLRQDGVQRRLVLTLPHFVSVLHAVEKSDLIAIVPTRLARRFAGMLRLQVLRCPVPLPDFQFSMLWHNRTLSDAAHLWLRSMVREAAAATLQQQK